MKLEIPKNGDVTVVVTRCVDVDLLEQTRLGAGASNTEFARALPVIAEGALGGAPR